MNDDLIYARVVNTVHINGQDVEYEAVSEEIPLPRRKRRDGCHLVHDILSAAECGEDGTPDFVCL